MSWYTVVIVILVAYIALALIPIDQARCKLAHRGVETVSVRVGRHQLLALSPRNRCSIDFWRFSDRLRSLCRALVCDSGLFAAQSTAKNALCVFGELSLLCSCLCRRINPWGMMRHVDAGTML